MVVRAAAANWTIRDIRRDGQFWRHAQEFVEQAYELGADLIVLPELFCLELLHLSPNLKPADAPKFLCQFAEQIEGWLLRMSQNSGIVIVGGSHFEFDDDRSFNVCPVAFPNGTLYRQRKNKLTVYERNEWKLTPGHGLTQLPGKLGVSVCYDSEFPEGMRLQAESGVLIHAVPAWTETRRGFQRVRWSCLARATENQNFVIHASLCGSIGREPVPESYGSSAIIAPSIAPFPMEAVLAESKLNEDDLILAGLDTGALFAARVEGEVTNWLDRDASNWVLGARPKSLAPWEKGG